MDIHHQAVDDTCRPRRIWLEAIGPRLAFGVWASYAVARCSAPRGDEHLLPQASGRVLRITNDDPRFSFAATARAARDGHASGFELPAPKSHAADTTDTRAFQTIAR